MRKNGKISRRYELTACAALQSALNRAKGLSADSLGEMVDQLAPRHPQVRAVDLAQTAADAVAGGEASRDFVRAVLARSAAAQAELLPDWRLG
jgi:hypothetical protein